MRQRRVGQNHLRDGARTPGSCRHRQSRNSNTRWPPWDDRRPASRRTSGCAHTPSPGSPPAGTRCRSEDCRDRRPAPPPASDRSGHRAAAINTESPAAIRVRFIASQPVPRSSLSLPEFCKCDPRFSFSKTCFTPEGQRISTLSIVVSAYPGRSGRAACSALRSRCRR